MCVVHFRRTTVHHPATNGLVERLHRTLKAAIMSHVEDQWTAAMPQVILGIRTAYRYESQSSNAELVYGENLSNPDELLVPPAPNVEASTLIQQLRRHMDKLRTTPAARHASPVTFIHKYLFGGTPHAAPWSHHTAARTK